MGIFSAIVDKIFHHHQASPQAAAPQPPAQPAATQAPVAPTQPTAAASSATPQAAAQPLRDVDVEAVLSSLAQQKGGGGNWRTSIVDLLKLLDLDSSLAARKELAGELNVHAGADGSAEENIALHRAVMEKLAQNGGKVPDSLRHAA